jgi:anthranilate phosphoribosyltransferase
MELLGVHHAFVVHGNAGANGIDEFSISGPSQFAEICGGRTFFAELTPEMVGLTTAPIETLRGGNAATNAAILRSTFAGEQGPRRDVVLLNSAAVLLAGGLLPVLDWVEALRAGIDLAAQTIDCGAVTALIADLATV